jgi:hypothetical protein
LNEAGDRVNEGRTVRQRGVAWRECQRVVCLGVRAQHAELEYGVIVGAWAPVHGSKAPVAFSSPRTTMMRQYRIEQRNDSGTPCIEFVGAQGFPGAILQARVRSLAEERSERCDMSNAFGVGVDAGLEADIHLAAVVKVNQKREPIAALIVERSNTC